jgi:hypothetical protein
MATIRLLADVANDPKGAVLSVSQDRAQRLLRTGYAEAVEEPEKTVKRKGKE